MTDEGLADDRTAEEANSPSVARLEVLGSDDDALDAEATVSRVVAAIRTESGAAAMLGNDPAPQRHAQAQDPSD